MPRKTSRDKILRSRLTDAQEELVLKIARFWAGTFAEIKHGDEDIQVRTSVMDALIRRGLVTWRAGRGRYSIAPPYLTTAGDIVAAYLLLREAEVVSRVHAGEAEDD